MQEFSSLTSYLVFNTVAKRGNLSAAAKELVISQPAVSRSLSKLENALSVKLFIRNSRGVRLTDEGNILYAHTKTAFDSLEQAQRCIERVNSLGLGTLRIGASSSLCRFLLTPKLKAYMKQNPNVKPDISLGNSEKIMKDVEDGLLDIGLINRPASVHRLEYLELMQLTDTFVASPDLIRNLKQKRLSSVKEIFESTTIFLPEEGSYTRHHLDSILDFNEVIPASITEVKNPDFMYDLALSGVGIAAVAKEFVTSELASGTLIELPLSLGGSKRSVGLCFEKTSMQSRSLSSFLSLYK